jgi:CDP-alcohol phosphatidyltransferase
MIPRRTCHISILQPWIDSTSRRSSVGIRMHRNHPSSSHVVRSALAYIQPKFRGIIWVPLYESVLHHCSGNCFAGSDDGFHRHDRRYSGTVITRNIWKNNRSDRGCAFQETSHKAAFSSDSSSNESTGNKVKEVRNRKASLQQDEGVNPLISKDLEPVSSYVVLQHWLEQLKSPPNMITASRILIIPFLSYWIVTEQTLPAIVGCIYAALSDVLDGHLARQYPHMQTALGTYLDPLGTSHRFLYAAEF